MWDLIFALVQPCLSLEFNFYENITKPAAGYCFKAEICIPAHNWLKLFVSSIEKVKHYKPPKQTSVPECDKNSVS